MVLKLDDSNFQISLPNNNNSLKIEVVLDADEKSHYSIYLLKDDLGVEGYHYYNKTLEDLFLSLKDIIDGNYLFKKYYTNKEFRKNDEIFKYKRLEVRIKRGLLKSREAKHILSYHKNHLDDSFFNEEIITKLKLLAL
ncbi:hypothetical protein Bp8pS_173 [Bacillus phage vB_BpuM-BpSp]|nr:hypothetical protein Bp8pS_173 [Bacillus phage vB_BpuM-BpSp]